MPATRDICAPAEQTEGTRSQVLRWLKQVGEHVTENEPLVEMETDKVTVEVAAPASGVLQEIVKREQEEVAPGDVLGRVALDSPADASAREQAQATATAAAPSGAEPRPSASASPPPHEPPTTRSTRARATMAPAVRRLLAERGIDPALIQGTGEGGRITVDDVLACEEFGPPATVGGESARATPDAEPGVPSHLVPHSTMRKRIAEHMVQSLLHTAPHVTSVFEADMSALSTHRARNKHTFEERGAPLTFTAYFIAAAVQAIRAVPEANSRWTDSALEIHDTINIGVATALEGVGLVVPVLRDVQRLDLFGIASALNEKVSAAREGRLQPADVRGGTFTISNHGVSGSLLAAPIVINQPQSAILGIGKMEKRPVVVSEEGEDRIVVRPKCYVTLTIDHRVMDGHDANRFLRTFVNVLESWPAS
ncbi:MAG: 2-oxo acid dehydrogenase subunit E2 [Steroidobacteraceae bacterium]|nr:2-oxo acid dehydrogenase subunit E2 [Steroidobacteraceae bacterium]